MILEVTPSLKLIMVGDAFNISCFEKKIKDKKTNILVVYFEKVGNIKYVKIKMQKWEDQTPDVIGDNYKKLGTFLNEKISSKATYF